MKGLSANEIKNYLEDTAFLRDCMNSLQQYTSTIVTLFQQLHTEMASFSSKLQEMGNMRETMNMNQLKSRMLEPLLIFAQTQQQLSEIFYDIQSAAKSINQSIIDTQQIYINPLFNSLQTHNSQSKWNIWSWWSQPNQEFTDATKIQLTLTLGSWEFKLKLGGTMEAIYRAFQDGSISASGDENFTKTMTKARIEKTKYFMKYKRCQGGYQGKTLDQILTMEEREGSIPSGIENIIENIKANGYTTEGIFRLSPSEKDIRDVYDRLGVIDFEGLDYILMAAVLKRFFRNLPEKVFNRINTNKALSINKIKAYNIGTLKSFIKGLPKNNIMIIKQLFGLLYKINTYSDTNKMNAQNLATIWIPCLFEIPQESPVVFSCRLNELKTFFVALIDNYYELFPDFSDRKSLRLSSCRKSCHQRTLTRSQSEWAASSESVDKNIK
ncbi:hypothetical protein ENUP19_0248G0060 [Entamoeba nuttalli]|uniref:RhoGAP domain containing protein n=2 Tax=Entamoeba nuttalli TaxID=412467 RepID=K2GVI2_ENTNP|nr:RhoGAP domain containing protein [Entamoeba nuttalli P19]EKE37837.1 RhoGAP domain containing protein [Entamoeba nuttalli P19]|eukprot:XP_008859831.1 RhoGAP domain containing protein [Entamoeba nuttalli P19]